MSRDFPMVQAYAKASYELLSDQGCDISECSGVFKQIYEVGQLDPQIKRILKEPFASSAFKIDLIYKLCPDLSKNEILRKLICLLADKKKLNLILDIFPAFEKIVNKESNSVSIELVASSELSESQVGNIKSALEGSIKKSIRVKQSVDKSLIAGVVVKTNEYVLDNSLKGRLNKMKQILVSKN